MDDFEILGQFVGEYDFALIADALGEPLSEPIV